MKRFPAFMTMSRSRERLLRSAFLFALQAIAGAVIGTAFFASCSSARVLVFGPPDVGIVGKVDKLETEDLKIGSITPINIDGTGNQAAAVMLVPRSPWYELLGTSDEKLNLDEPDPQPELVIVESGAGKIIELYRFRPEAVDDAPEVKLNQVANFHHRSLELVRSGLRASLSVADIDSDGRDEVLVLWQSIGAGLNLQFETITDLADGSFQTVDPLPQTFTAAYFPTQIKYDEFWISNAYDHEVIYVHAAQAFHNNDGRLVVSIQGEYRCMGCIDAAYHLYVVIPKSSGTRFDPDISKTVFVPQRMYGDSAPSWLITVENLLAAPSPY